MKIKLTPRLSDAPIPEIRVDGDTVTINGEAFDFSQLPAGYELPARAIESTWFSGQVERSAEGDITVDIILPHCEDAGENVRFPADIEIKEGSVPLPVTKRNKEAQENDID